jgi:acyl-homoserine-lactone acylase
VVDRCRTAGSVLVEERQVDLAAVADVLAAWDRRFDLGSRGAALWREAMAGFPAAAWRDAGTLFAEAFDPADPLGTPRGLASAPAEGDDPVVVAVAHAAIALEAAGVSIDSSLEEVQWAVRGTDRVPVHGGDEGDGVCNVLAPHGALPAATLEPGPPAPTPVAGRHERTGLARGGYQVTYGTSFLMAVEVTDDGPVGLGLLAYGNSGDPRSPHHRDGTEAYAAKAPRPLLFRRRDIDADPNATRRTVTG